jgi:hypothetical protein
VRPAHSEAIVLAAWESPGWVGGTAPLGVAILRRRFVGGVTGFGGAR